MIRPLKELAAQTDGVDKLDRIVMMTPIVRDDEYDLSCLVATLADLDALDDDIGNLSAVIGDLNFTGVPVIDGDTTVSEALCDLAVVAGSSNVVLSVRETPETGCVATYDLCQGGVVKGTVNVPKDFAVRSVALSVVTDEGVPYAAAHIGDKYIDFVINARDDSEIDQHIYLPVNDLVDVYTVQEHAAQVQLAISDTNVISASIVAGSVGTVELTDKSVTNEKLADDSVTAEKIAAGSVGTNAIAIEDEAVPGDFYTVSIRNGRLIVRKLS